MTKDIEKIYLKLRDDIITFKLPPNARLRETEVAEDYNVSRTPIRDVFKALEMNGLLEIHSKSGSFVTKIDLEGLNNMMYLRYSTEHTVYQELVGKLTERDFDALYAILSHMKQNSYVKRENQDSDFANAYFDLDNEFHQYLYAKAGQESVLQFLNDQFPTFQRYRFTTFLRDDTDLENLYTVHEKLIKVLESGNREELRDIIHEHNYSGIKGLDAVKSRFPDYFD